MVWVDKGETPNYCRIKIYCSACGTLIEPDDGDHSIFRELSKEWKCNSREKILQCTVSEVESRYFGGMLGYVWVSLYRLSRCTTVTSAMGS